MLSVTSKNANLQHRDQIPPPAVKPESPAAAPSEIEMKTIVPPIEFKTELTQGGVKAATTDVGAKSRDLWMVPIDRISIVSGLNVRIHDDEYEAHVEAIKNSIMEHGFYPHFPIPGYAGKEGDANLIYATGGFTRLEAAKRAIKAGAAIEALPVVLKPPGTSMLDLNFALALDNTGASLKPYERAIVVKRAIGYGVEEATIATKMNITEQYVKDLLYLLGLPNSIQQMVIKGQSSAGHAIATARKHGATEAVKVLQGALTTGATPAAGSGNGSGSAPSAGRVAPRSAATQTGASGIIPKKMFLEAIKYAIALPSDGIEWLGRWYKKEDDAVKELIAVVDSRKRPTTAAGKAAKAAALKKKKEALKAKKTADKKAGAKKTGKKDATPAAVDPAFAAPGEITDDNAPL